jgi:hypothetical protein
VWIKQLRAVLLFSLLIAAFGQDSSKPQETLPARAEADGFYSGTVSELAEGKVTVTRAILGKPAEKRMFLMNADTKVEGKMKTRSRVTVKYSETGDGDVALSILVRDKVEKKK